jgi:PAS domain S-box-containing protein
VTPEVLAALRIIVADVGADAGALVRLTGSGRAIVTSSTLPGTVGLGDSWVASDRLADEILESVLVTDESAFAQFVPTAFRLALPGDITGVLVASVSGTPSRMVLVWCRDAPPADAVARLRAGAFEGFSMLAPLLDAQVEALSSAARLQAVVSSLEQAVVVVDGSGRSGEVNAAAATLLGLREGAVPADQLAAAMRELRNRSTSPAEVAERAEQLLTDPHMVVRDWIWTLHGSPSHLRVNSAPISGIGVSGRVWVFDDISAQMDLLTAEQAARAEVARSEERYRLLAENVTDVVVVGDNRGCITWVSPSVTDTMGWRAIDLEGVEFRTLVHPDDVPVVAPVQESVARGVPGGFEARLRAADGSYRWMSVRVKPIMDASGAVVGRVAGWWDAHDQHVAREALAVSEARYRLLAENASDVVFQATADMTLLWVSPSIRDLTGLEPEELVGRPGTVLVHEPDIALMWQAVSAAAGSGRVAFRARYRAADGSLRWAETTVRSVQGVPGEEVSRVGSMRDVHEQVVAELALADAEERYRLVAENATDVVCRYTPDGVIDWAFGSTEALVGLSPEQLVGTRTVDHLLPDDLGPSFEAQVAALHRGETVTGPIRLRRADGGTHWIDRRTRAVLDADGTMLYVVSAWRDAQAEVDYRTALTESQREALDLAAAYEVARNEAMEANLAKTAFLSRMSHELRTPLNAVIGFAQLLALDPLTEDQLDAVQHIRTGGKHLLELINEILDISRIEAGRLSLSMEAVTVGDAVSEALDLVRPIATDAGIALHSAEARASRLTVSADRQRAIQILLNLLTNAVKYNRPSGEVTVSVDELPDGQVAVRVADTGMGIATENLARLFQPFDRLGAEASAIEGTGIGLTLSQGLARVMGGHIDVETEVGRGSVFSLVLLPTAPAIAEVIADEAATVTSLDGTVRILYIEDNPANAELMSRIVGLRPGATMVLAENGAAGLRAAREDPPDLLFLDLHLPDLRGEEVLRRLQQDQVTAGIPVVIVTADASPDIRPRILAQGAAGFLTKPLELADVLAWIDRPSGHPGA